MKRSVILMGGKTYVVSLPSQWIKKYGVAKGEEVEVEERENAVVISTGNRVTGKETEVNLSSIGPAMIGRCIGALYKAGYTKVKVLYDSKEQLDKIEETLRRTCIGFEVTEQGKNFVVIKNLTQLMPEEFDNSLRRLFYTLEIMNQDLIAASDAASLRKVIEKDDQVNKLADLLRRVVNSGDTKLLYKPHIMYYLVEQLERMGDCYKGMARHVLDEKQPLTKSDKASLEKINALLLLYRKMFYDFTLEDVERFGTAYVMLQTQLKAVSSPLSVYQRLLIENIFDMNGALLTARL